MYCVYKPVNTKDHGEPPEAARSLERVPSQPLEEPDLPIPEPRVSGLQTVGR